MLGSMRVPDGGGQRSVWCSLGATGAPRSTSEDLTIQVLPGPQRLRYHRHGRDVTTGEKAQVDGDSILNLLIRLATNRTEHG